MRYVRPRFVATLLGLLCFQASGQGQTLSITNYRFVSEQIVTSTQSRVTYRADLVNPGQNLASVAATVASQDPFGIRVVPGQGTLNFTNVPAHGQVTSTDTFTVIVTTGASLD